VTESPAQPQPKYQQQSPVPAITLPKGGGAIRGIGEKFTANPVTGTASMTVPIATSPGRGGFGPQLALSYDSGAGNGPFGFGWSLSLPSITRKTDKGLPQYFDKVDSDVFILSGAEDLVPVYRQDADGSWVASHAGYQRDPNGFWVRGQDGLLVIHEAEFDGYRVRRYRPRIEGLFARIERWSKVGAPSDVHWRSISKDNILTVYGLDADSRIADPLDASHIFTWMICESRDDKGNAVLYRYKTENGMGVDLGQVHERNRGPQNDPRRTANRYVKRIRYGNRTPLLDKAGHRPRFLDESEIDTQIGNANWMFEVVFDYCDHDAAVPKPNDDEAKDVAGSLKYPWKSRPDPFSTYRSGFEVRTTRLCERVLMFHHFPGETDIQRDCLVRSTDFTYSDVVDPTDVRDPVYTFLQAVIQTGYRRNNGGYDKRSMPPVEFEYTEPIVQDAVEKVDSESLENLPIGLDGSAYRWTDLHGEGIPGILTEQGGSWFYKRNLSPIPETLASGEEQVKVQFAPLETVAVKPSVALGDGAEFMDLAGDGQPDVVVMDGSTPGLYEHDEAEGWQPFRPFTSRLNRDMRGPNLKFVDLDGDGHADVLISEDDAFVWHASLAEAGFGPARRVVQALDEEKAPRIVFADGTQSIYLADLSGDGLTDIVRVRNAEICYWPNLGYGRFGAKIAMDNAPAFDNPDQFDQKRIRLADVDGSGTTDIIYLHRDGVRLYFNQAGNGWSQPHLLKVFPRIDDVVSIVLTDLLGNGTASLVWSSPLPDDARRQMRYVNLMGGQKPHLLVKTINNLGAETRVEYAPSTKFYLQDKRDGNPWITRLPFPVHVVERVETVDHISRNRFVTRYAYHHGYFDGEEREFRGFGMVEQSDTEELAALTADGQAPVGMNLEASSHVPPVLTRAWFHTGASVGRGGISKLYAGLTDPHDRGEYYREPGWLDDDEEASKRLLDDTVLPSGLTADEEREACRALKGVMLRQEVYALDGVGADAYPHGHPYTVAEQNFTVQLVQRRGQNRHAVFLTHPREAVTYHYERNPGDPRVEHALTLEVDAYGNVLRSMAVGYGREAVAGRRQEQEETHVTLTINRVANRDDQWDWRRIGLPVETCTYEVVRPPTAGFRFRWDALRTLAATLIPLDKFEPSAATTIPYEQWDWRSRWDSDAEPGGPGKSGLRLIEHVRTLYRPDDLGSSHDDDPLELLPLGSVESRASPGESYQLAFTPGLLAAMSHLLPDPAAVLGAQEAAGGGYVDLDGDGHWWVPSGRLHFSPGNADTAAQELAYALRHFFLPHRYRDPFHTATTSTETVVTFDDYDLLLTETQDALGNRVTVGERAGAGNAHGNDYRVLQARLATDPNGNRSAVQFDALGMVVGTAVMGKAPPAPAEGDSLDGFDADLTGAVVRDHLAAPLTNPHAILQRATTRLVYDLFAYHRTKAQPDPAPVIVYTLARETHDADLGAGKQTKIRHSFSYSDGFGREIQRKLQAEPGPVPERDTAGKIIVDADNQPTTTSNDVRPRWVGSGWTVFNNKGNPIRQYEPFFTDTHRFEFDTRIGVCPVLLYDPLERVVATLHPNHTWEKAVFTPWRQETWDVNDTILLSPQEDDHVRGFFVHTDGTPRLPVATYSPTWHALRTHPAHAAEASRRWRDPRTRDAERQAANKTSPHAATPTVAHADTLGRAFLTIAHNKLKYSDTAPTDPAVEQFHPTRVILDIEGNQREVIDAKDRVVVRYIYDLLGSRIFQASIEAGERWTLHDVAGALLYRWDGQDHRFRISYDRLRRPTESFLRHGRSAELVVERSIYGETYPNPEAANLRGRVAELFDQAGILTTDSYDFKGNLLGSRRQLARAYDATLDWSASVPCEVETFTNRTRYDAFNRPTQLIAPHSDLPGTKVKVVQLTYNEASLLDQVHGWLNQNTEPTAQFDSATADLHAVTNVDYDAKGQRTRICYGNHVTTSYTYDPLTFRLVRLHTRREAVTFKDDCPQPVPAAWPGCDLQDLHYSYDPLGNVTDIRDDAQQAVYFRNRRVEPSGTYTYDALYRLIEATGREHLGQLGGPMSHTYNDARRVGLPSRDTAGQFAPNDGNAIGAYLERYVYDAVGNHLSMQHRGSDPVQPGWVRTYVYAEASLIESGKGGTQFKASNRLSRTTVGNGSPITESYGYDAHGNMVSMPQLQVLRWDFRDQLVMSQRQKVNNQDEEGIPRHGERTYYVYDAAGNRVRKVTELANGDLKNERITFLGLDIDREYVGANAGLVRVTLHLMADEHRMALVESRNDVNDGSPKQVVRYQIGNHVGSAVLELDDQGRIISYEEYTPYGSTTYQAVRSQTETPKRYRFTGKERDQESGMYYHGARYYAPWLGRWTSCDPSGIEAGLNLYIYGSANPVRFVDPAGNDAVDTVGGCYASVVDNFFLIRKSQSDLEHMSEAFQKAYARCDWGGAIHSLESAKATRKNIASNKVASQVVGSVVGLASVLHPNPPSPDDVPPEQAEYYAMFKFASTYATAIIQGRGMLRSIASMPPPPGRPPTLALATGSTGPRTNALTATAATSLEIPTVFAMASTPSKPQAGEPDKPRTGEGVGQLHPTSGFEILEVIIDEETKLDVQVEVSKPSQQGKLTKRFLNNPGTHDPSARLPNDPRAAYVRTKTVMPPNQVELFRQSIEFEGKRYAMDAAGNIHQFQPNAKNVFHWAGAENAGTASGATRPLEIPPDVRRLLQMRRQ
jgi:RHS repeat-associated protein